jgi:sugar phosphate isomerase/epimerase
MKNRRDFLKITSVGLSGTLALGSMAGCSFVKNGGGVGLQLYSIRDAMAADALGSLKKVANMGYKFVELAGYSDGKFYGMAPAEFKKVVEDLGMQIISSHTMVEAKGIALENAQKMADDHALVGAKFCVQPWINDEDRSIGKYKRMIADWNKVGEIMKDVGIQFAYHNHNFEFLPTNGIVPYFDIFLKEMDPELISMELDMYWVTKAGHDPVELFKKYPGRFQLFHFKDGTTQNGPYFDVIKNDITSVGSGYIDFNRIYEARKTAGMKYVFVEDDNQGNGKPFEGIKRSIDNVNNDILS